MLLRALDLFPSQELLIMNLWEKGPQTQTELVRFLRFDHSTIAKSLRRMEVAGLIARRPSAEDRRATVVSLTPKGRAIRKKIEGVWGQLERASALSPEERKHLVRLMARVEKNVASVAARVNERLLRPQDPGRGPSRRRALQTLADADVALLLGTGGASTRGRAARSE
jgi:DNA-binding MarR family transcriptional regulator